MTSKTGHERRGATARQDVRALHLVSRRWVHTARPILFESVLIRPNVESFSMLELMSKTEPDQPRECVRLRDCVKAICYDGSTINTLAPCFDNWRRCSAGAGLGLLKELKDDFLRHFTTQQLKEYYVRYLEYSVGRENILRRNAARNLFQEAFENFPNIREIRYTKRSKGEMAFRTSVPALTSLSAVARQILAEPKSYHRWEESEQQLWALLQSACESGHYERLESIHGSRIDLKRWNDIAATVDCHGTLPALRDLSLEFDLAPRHEGETKELSDWIASASSLPPCVYLLKGFQSTIQLLPFTLNKFCLRTPIWST